METRKHVLLLRPKTRGIPPDADVLKSIGKGTKPESELRIPEPLEIEVPDLSDGEAQELPLDSSVLAFAPVVELRLHEPLEAGPLDPETDVAWGVRAVRADTSRFDGRGVTVAVLDTGICRDHPAFARVRLVEQDFTGEGDGDQNGHGTHCSGTLFGGDVDGFRIGIARGIEQALIGKVLRADGGGTTEGLIRGMTWALNLGANVVSLSLGIDFPGIVERLQHEGIPARPAVSMGLDEYRKNVELFGKVAALARGRGVMLQASIVLAATGNESNRPEFHIMAGPPAAAEDILAVGAVGSTTSGLEVARFSNRNANLVAPGVGTTSANKDGGLQTLSGTSMATPHVAGVAALWADKLMRLGPLEVQEFLGRLMASGVRAPLVKGFHHSDVGAGLVQAPQK